MIAIAIPVIYIFFLPHTVNHALDGYIIYSNGSKMNCSVSIRGKYQYDIIGYSHFDGNVYVNDVPVGLAERVMFCSGNGFSGYSGTEVHDAIVTTTYMGDLLMNEKCNSVVLSCCYDDTGHSETTDEAYRCLIIAPAQNISDVKKHFRAWDFDNFNITP